MFARSFVMVVAGVALSVSLLAADGKGGRAKGRVPEGLRACVDCDGRYAGDGRDGERWKDRAEAARERQKARREQEKDRREWEREEVKAASESWKEEEKSRREWEKERHKADRESRKERSKDRPLIFPMSDLAGRYTTMPPVCEVSYPAAISSLRRNAACCNTSRNACIAGNPSDWRGSTRS